MDFNIVRWLEALEMLCLRELCGVNIVHRIQSMEISRCGVTSSGSSSIQRVEECLLRWFRYLARMEQNSMIWMRLTLVDNMRQKFTF